MLTDLKHHGKGDVRGGAATGATVAALVAPALRPPARLSPAHARAPWLVID